MLDISFKIIAHFFNLLNNTCLIFRTERLNTLSDIEQAQLTIDLAGSPEKALAIARSYEQASSLVGVQKSIVILKSLRLTNPSAEADQGLFHGFEENGLFTDQRPDAQLLFNKSYEGGGFASLMMAARGEFTMAPLFKSNLA